MMTCCDTLPVTKWQEFNIVSAQLSVRCRNNTGSSLEFSAQLIQELNGLTKKRTKKREREFSVQLHPRVFRSSLETW